MTWPPERFYWSLIDLPGWKKTGQLPPALLHEVQHDLPVEVDDLHAVCLPLSDGLLLVCAARRDELEALETTTLALTPSDIPAMFLSAPAVPATAPLGVPGGQDDRLDTLPAGADPSALNLLVGDFEAGPIRRARVRRHIERMVAMLTCVALLWFGLDRRAAVFARQAAMTIDSANAEAGDPALTQNPDELAIRLASLSRLRAAAAAKVAEPADAAATLASLLRRWPASSEAVPQSVSISASTITVSVTTRGEPSDFLRGFKPPDGWRLEEPRVSTGPDSARIMLELHPLKNSGRIP